MKLYNPFKRIKALERELAELKDERNSLKIDIERHIRFPIKMISDLPNTLWEYLWHTREPYEISGTKTAKEYLEAQREIAKQVKSLLKRHEKNERLLKTRIRAARPEFEERHIKAEINANPPKFS